MSAKEILSLLEHLVALVDLKASQTNGKRSLVLRTRSLSLRAIVVVGCFLSMTTYAAPHKVLDLTTMSDPAGTFEVSLCSRPSPNGNIPGHAFVLYGMKPHGGDRRVVALGYTTSVGAAKASLSFTGWSDPVPGYMGEERYTSSKEKCLVARVDKKVFDAAWQEAHLKSNLPGLDQIRFIGEYKLGDKDCMEFMIRVAKLLPDVQIPARGATDLPQSYMRRLIEAN